MFLINDLLYKIIFQTLKTLKNIRITIHRSQFYNIIHNIIICTPCHYGWVCGRIRTNRESPPKCLFGDSNGR